MVRLGIIVFCAGIYLMCSGGYDLYVQSGTSKQPTTISVAELEKNVPPNRHLVVTGGRAVATAAVKFYKTKWGSKVSGSEILFVPIADATVSTNEQSATPTLVLRVTEDQINAAKAGKKVNFQAIEGIRTTSMDLEGKARQRLVDTYGQAAVDRMIILNYHGGVGMGTAFGKLAGGIALSGGLIAAIIFTHRSKQAGEPIASSTPPMMAR